MKTGDMVVFSSAIKNGIVGWIRPIALEIVT